MKKLTPLSVLFLLFFFTFTFNKAIAGPGDSCSSAISLSTTTSFSDYAFHSPDTAVWFSFIADSSNMLIALSSPVLPADTPAAYIHTLKLYSGTCGGLSLMSSNTIVSFGNDTLPQIYQTGLTPGTKYYVSVSKYYTVGCRICNTSVSYMAINIMGLFSTIMPTATCGTTCGPNLVCNGNFTVDAPVTMPTNYQIPLTSCAAASGLNYVAGYGAADSYAISRISSPPPNVYVVPTGPPPTGQPYSFCGNSPNSPSGPAGAWFQIVPVVPNAQYQWSAYFKDLDLINGRYGTLPGATLSMVVGVAPPLFTGVINNANYNNWVEVCEDWTAGPTQTTATLVIVDQQGGSPSIAGYDFLINNISFAMIAPPPPIISGQNYACGSASLAYTVTNPMAGASFAWTVSGAGNSISPSGNPVTASFATVPAIITCTETLAGGCSSVGTYTVGACCASSPYSVYINNEDAITAGTSFSNVTILIDGTFTVDVPIPVLPIAKWSLAPTPPSI